ncbi:MAG: YdeI/OmpD-associated family protein [Polyangiales bacterium]
MGARKVCAARGPWPAHAKTSRLVLAAPSETVTALRWALGAAPRGARHGPGRSPVACAPRRKRARTAQRRYHPRDEAARSHPGEERPAVDHEARPSLGCPSPRVRPAALREVVRDAAPDAEARMAYGMPTWHQRENLVHLAGYAGHVGLYPGPAAIEAFAEALRPYKTSKGAVQIPHDVPLPTGLVREITAWRVAQVGVAGAPARRTGADTLRDPGPLEFTETLRAAGGTAACFVPFPWDLKETFGRGNLVPVSARWDDRVTYQGALAMMGGERAMLLCRKDILAQLGKSAGDAVTVTVRLDLAPRVVEVPEALAAALDAQPDARARWEALSPSCRREYAQWIAEAKRPETRDARVAKALPRIVAGARLKG